MDFVAIDVETANPNYASICSIGIVHFKDGRVFKEFRQLVDPEDYFCPWHCSRAGHGISEQTVCGAPTMTVTLPGIQTALTDQVVVSHSLFDRLALCQAAARYDIPELSCRSWLDVARVVRRAWPEYSQSGYRLSNIASVLGIEFKHHDPVEDARACGEVLIRAIEKTGLTLEQWLIRARQPIRPRIRLPIMREGNPDGPLAGEVIAFTGALTIPRRQAADMAAEAGCSVKPGVTSGTTILVVGDQDLSRLAGHKKSSKHRRAESLIAAGHPIRIVGETDFRRLIQLQ